MNEQLNEAQKRALCHKLGPAMVLAGPGSGKTTVITGRVKRLIEQSRIPPSAILVITYTKAAALSMQQRFYKEMQGAAAPVTFGTFHAVYYHILKEHYHLNDHCLITEKEKNHILNLIWKQQFQTEPEEDRMEQLRLCLALYKNGMAKERLPLPPDFSPEQFDGLYAAYNRYCMAKGKLDFDDMQVRCRDLFCARQDILEKWQGRFLYILVDEFQDCNQIQYETLRLLAAPHRNLFVVGDDDQSIYGFRGASPDIMQRFIQDYPEAEKIYLEANYRSRTEIIAAADCVISANKKRFAKKMYAAGKNTAALPAEPVCLKSFADREEEYSYLTAKLRRLSEWIPYREMCVMFRTNREMCFLLPFLERSGIPYTVKGQVQNKYNHFAVRDINAYLELAAGERGRGLFLQVMNRPERGIEREMLWEEKISLSEMERECTAGRKEKTAEAVKLLQKQLQIAGGFSPSLAIRFVRKAMGYENWLRGRAGLSVERYEEWRELLDDIQKEAEKFAGIREWLAFVGQAEENVSEGKNKAGVQLMTMHASKGLEFTYVCIPDANEKKRAGVCSAEAYRIENAEEEERRLFYVGMTRAKTALDILYLTECPRPPSRFIEPLLQSYLSVSSTSSSNS
ncbi:MAG: ATP-dependent helicase [Lachnospiraceae bacterium]|nr:ATP-dependent helicase [Lachnospiraceae bacterium]